MIKLAPGISLNSGLLKKDRQLDKTRCLFIEIKRFEAENESNYSMKEPGPRTNNMPKNTW